ncbi:hypothetical protein MMC09_002148 [Bachmanniomyces sp. S44760]|nr:hypothetical protein [Bachmanniomyces sp. S44760]
MHKSSPPQHHCIPDGDTSHPDNPIPEEPVDLPKEGLRVFGLDVSSAYSNDSSTSPETASPKTPETDPHLEGAVEGLDLNDAISKSSDLNGTTERRRRASTILLSQNSHDVRKILSDTPEGGTKLVEKACCGGGCCLTDLIVKSTPIDSSTPIIEPDNEAFRSLMLKLGPLHLETKLENVVPLPPQTVFLDSISSNAHPPQPRSDLHPPSFVTPHPPYDVYSAKVHHARELTKSGAEKRTYHFDLDVTDYPAESGDVDFVVGGAIGICAPNDEGLVNDIFTQLSIPSFTRDKVVTLRTTSGRWPTIWGEEESRELMTTRRELLTWCSDVQSYPPTKPLLRLLGEYASDIHEQKILFYLSSAQGQPAFCELRTGPHITLAQLLSAFPSSKPPLPHLLSVLNTLMPRFYSLSHDPSISCQRDGTQCRRLIEIAVTVHESPNWRGGPRLGLGSGYLERVAQRIQSAEKDGKDPLALNLRVPMFRGLMANPLAREFVSDGPMLLIGAGVGIAPFRGFVQKRLKSANCANKVWVLQGVRDSLLDELYSGEWGVEESKVKKVVQSRKAEGRYVQEEVRNQADLVWFVINALDGRVFVCGSSKGMGEGVESALVDVVMDKGGLSREEAEVFWKRKKEGGQYIAELW